MIDPGKVQGKKLSDLFNLLVEKKTIISISVVGTDFERLTCVVDARDEKDNQYFVIDLPQGFRQAASKSESLNLRFNFNGPDSLEYIFNTSGGIYNGQSLQIPFPDYIERLQRRRNFRINTPPNARMLFKSKKLEGMIGLINISLGGVFGALVEHNLEDVKGSVLKKDQRIFNIGLIFPADEEMEEQIILIRKAEVRRVEHDKEKKIFKYAFEFLDIDRGEFKKLTQAIYHIQRQQLQRR
jgi:hypothetical protein